jgi:predicted nucleic acid-binding protein
MRVMLDTNVLISGMVFQGPERWLLEAVCECHTLVVNDYLLAEATDVLARKFPGRERLLDTLLQSLTVERLPLPPATMVREASGHLRNARDAAVLASALYARPDVFVSGDKDLHTPEVQALIRVCGTKGTLALLAGE